MKQQRTDPERRWSIRTAAEIAGVSTNTWFSVEHGNRIDDIRRNAIGDVFGWTAQTWEHLLAGGRLDELPGEHEQPSEPEPERDAMDFHADLSDISPEGRAAIQHIIDIERGKQKP